jgi:hypothetical protein
VIRRFSIVVVPGLSVVLGAVVLSGAASAGSHAATDGRVDAFRTALESGGLSVRDGITQPVELLQWVDKRYLNSAAGNNAGQPYKHFVLVPPPPKPARPQLSTFRLAPYEAVVYLGPTPPPCDYFSFTSFLWLRHYRTRPVRDWLFASVGDPLNNALVKTEGGGSPFDRNTMIIFTADRAIYERVAAAARAAGYPASMINLYVLPSKLLQMGLKASSDTFSIVMRTANFKNQAEGNRYLADDHWGHVFRITPSTIPALHPLPTPPARARNWRPEASVVPGVGRALESLRRAILAKTPHTTAEQFGSQRWFPLSRAVLTARPGSPDYRKFAAGESTDTPYLRSARNGAAARFKLGQHDRVVVYGVNHAATGLATYSSFGVYGEFDLNSCQHQVPFFLYGCGNPIWNGVASMTNHQFAGSARRYLPHDRLARYLYAITVVRTTSECPGGPKDRYCLVVPRVKNGKRPPSATVIGLDYPLTIGYRAYLNPHTDSGLSYSDIIPDRAILFPSRS